MKTLTFILISFSFFIFFTSCKNELSEQKITIDYSLSFSEMKKSANYDGIDSYCNITTFPSPESCGKKRKTVKLFHFSELISIADATVVLDRAGFYCGNFRELVAFNSAYPNSKKSSKIIRIISRLKATANVDNFGNKKDLWIFAPGSISSQSNKMVYSSNPPDKSNYVIQPMSLFEGTPIFNAYISVNKKRDCIPAASIGLNRVLSLYWADLKFKNFYILGIKK